MVQFYEVNEKLKRTRLRRLKCNKYRSNNKLKEKRRKSMKLVCKHYVKKTGTPNFIHSIRIRFIIPINLYYYLNGKKKLCRKGKAKKNIK